MSTEESGEERIEIETKLPGKNRSKARPYSLVGPVFVITAWKVTILPAVTPLVEAEAGLRLVLTLKSRQGGAREATKTAEATRKEKARAMKRMLLNAVCVYV
jgi:hypothetical protein